MNKILPVWFKDRYKVELKEDVPGRYWIRIEDMVKVLDDITQTINYEKIERDDRMKTALEESAYMQNVLRPKLKEKNMLIKGEK